MMCEEPAVREVKRKSRGSFSNSERSMAEVMAVTAAAALLQPSVERGSEILGGCLDSSETGHE